MRFQNIIADISFVIENFIPIITQKYEKKAAEYLVKNALTISTAESCTGGLVSSRLTDVSGSSAYILQNFVTYANEAKVQLLGVSPQTIKEHGVVSNEVALEMVQGLLKKYNCSLALSITGIAGPLGATDTKPVGLVYIGIANDKTAKTYKYEANPLLSRRLMKYAFSNKAFELLLDFLKENYLYLGN